MPSPRLPIGIRVQAPEGGMIFSRSEDRQETVKEKVVTKKDRTKAINRFQRKYPGSTRQRNDHGCGRYSVEFFDKKTGKLLATVEL